MENNEENQIMATQSFWKAAFSSANGRWETPWTLIDELSLHFDWTLDVCASRPNVCANYYDGSPGRDGLIEPWHGLCWMNPPYGREIGKWTARAVDQYRRNRATIVALLPARTDTRWWQKDVSQANDIIFIRGRLRFGSREFWIQHYQEKILTLPHFDQIVKKIGGALCDKPAATRAYSHWPKNLKFSWHDWIKMDYLKPEAAPFPSAFVVWGALRSMQIQKLAFYGMHILL